MFLPNGPLRFSFLGALRKENLFGGAFLSFGRPAFFLFIIIIVTGKPQTSGYFSLKVQRKDALKKVTGSGFLQIESIK